MNKKSKKDFSTIIRSFLSHDGVIGGKERWWSGNKDFDFLIDNENEEVLLLKIFLLFSFFSF